MRRVSRAILMAVITLVVWLSILSLAVCAVLIILGVLRGMVQVLGGCLS